VLHKIFDTTVKISYSIEIGHPELVEPSVKDMFGNYGVLQL
jgi:hypothetical protein